MTRDVLEKRTPRKARLDGPLVSICVPTYNGARYLEEALNSALAQTYSDCEIVVSDDRSSDGTADICRRVLEGGPFPFRIVEHEPAGIGANWNHAVQNARGTYIKFLFQDDLLKPDCVERMVAILETDPDIGLVYCDREILAMPGIPAERPAEWNDTYATLTRFWRGELSGPRPGRELLGREDLFDSPRNKIGEPIVVMFPKAVWEHVGPFSEWMVQCLDYDFWYRVMAEYKIAVVDEPLAVFRLHPDQATSRNVGKRHMESWGCFLRHIVDTPVGPCLHPHYREEARHLGSPWGRLRTSLADGDAAWRLRAGAIDAVKRVLSCFSTSQ